MPETWRAIEPTFGEHGLFTQSEKSHVNFVKMAHGGSMPDLDDNQTRQELLEVLSRSAFRQQQKDQASVDRYNSLPRNSKHDKNS